MAGRAGVGDRDGGRHDVGEVDVAQGEGARGGEAGVRLSKRGGSGIARADGDGRGVVGAGDRDDDVAGHAAALGVVDGEAVGGDDGLTGGQVLDRGIGEREGPAGRTAVGGGGDAVTRKRERVGEGRGKFGRDRGAARRGDGEQAGGDQRGVGDVEVGEGERAAGDQGRGSVFGDRAREGGGRDGRGVVGAGDDDHEGLRAGRRARLAVVDGERVSERELFAGREVGEVGGGGREREGDGAVDGTGSLRGDARGDQGAELGGVQGQAGRDAGSGDGGDGSRVADVGQVHVGEADGEAGADAGSVGRLVDVRLGDRRDHRGVVDAGDRDRDVDLGVGALRIGGAQQVELGVDLTRGEGLGRGQGVVDGVGPLARRSIDGEHAVGGGTVAGDAPGDGLGGVDVGTGGLAGDGGTVLGDRGGIVGGQVDDRRVVGAVDGDGDGLEDRRALVVDGLDHEGLGDGLALAEGLGGGLGVIEDEAPGAGGVDAEGAVGRGRRADHAPGGGGGAVDVRGGQLTGDRGDAAGGGAVVERAVFGDRADDVGARVGGGQDVVRAVDRDGDRLIDDRAELVGRADHVGLRDGLAFAEGLRGGLRVVQDVRPGAGDGVELEGTVGVVARAAGDDGVGAEGRGVDVGRGDRARDGVRAREQRTAVVMAGFRDGTGERRAAGFRTVVRAVDRDRDDLVEGSALVVGRADRERERDDLAFAQGLRGGEGVVEGVAPDAARGEVERTVGIGRGADEGPAEGGGGVGVGGRERAGSRDRARDRGAVVEGAGFGDGADEGGGRVGHDRRVVGAGDGDDDRARARGGRGVRRGDRVREGQRVAGVEVIERVGAGVEAPGQGTRGLRVGERTVRDGEQGEEIGVGEAVAGRAGVGDRDGGRHDIGQVDVAQGERACGGEAGVRLGERGGSGVAGADGDRRGVVRAREGHGDVLRDGRIGGSTGVVADRDGVDDGDRLAGGQVLDERVGHAELPIDVAVVLAGHVAREDEGRGGTEGRVEGGGDRHAGGGRDGLQADRRGGDVGDVEVREGERAGVGKGRGLGVLGQGRVDVDRRDRRAVIGAGDVDDDRAAARRAVAVNGDQRVREGQDFALGEVVEGFEAGIEVPGEGLAGGAGVEAGPGKGQQALELGVVEGDAGRDAGGDDGIDDHGSRVGAVDVDQGQGTRGDEAGVGLGEVGLGGIGAGDVDDRIVIDRGDREVEAGDALVAVVRGGFGRFRHIVREDVGDGRDRAVPILVGLEEEAAVGVDGQGAGAFAVDREDMTDADRVPIAGDRTGVVRTAVTVDRQGLEREAGDIEFVLVGVGVVREQVASDDAFLGDRTGVIDTDGRVIDLDDRDGEGAGREEVGAGVTVVGDRIVEGVGDQRDGAEEVQHRHERVGAVRSHAEGALPCQRQFELAGRAVPGGIDAADGEPADDQDVGVVQAGVEVEVVGEDVLIAAWDEAGVRLDGGDFQDLSRVGDAGRGVVDRDEERFGGGQGAAGEAGSLDVEHFVFDLGHVAREVVGRREGERAGGVDTERADGGGAVRDHEILTCGGPGARAGETELADDEGAVDVTIVGLHVAREHRVHAAIDVVDHGDRRVVDGAEVHSGDDRIGVRHAGDAGVASVVDGHRDLNPARKVVQVGGIDFRVARVTELGEGRVDVGDRADELDRVGLGAGDREEVGVRAGDDRGDGHAGRGGTEGQLAEGRDEIDRVSGVEGGVVVARVDVGDAEAGDVDGVVFVDDDFAARVDGVRRVVDRGQLDRERRAGGQVAGGIGEIAGGVERSVAAVVGQRVGQRVVADDVGVADIAEVGQGRVDVGQGAREGQRMGTVVLIDHAGDAGVCAGVGEEDLAAGDREVGRVGGVGRIDIVRRIDIGERHARERDDDVFVAEEATARVIGGGGTVESRQDRVIDRRDVDLGGRGGNDGAGVVFDRDGHVDGGDVAVEVLGAVINQGLERSVDLAASTREHEG